MEGSKVKNFEKLQNNIVSKSVKREQHYFNFSSEIYVFGKFIFKSLFLYTLSLPIKTVV